LNIVRALRHVAGVGRIGQNVLGDLLSTVPELQAKPSKFQGTREDRTRAVQGALNVLGSASGTEGQLRDCVAGCPLLQATIDLMTEFNCMGRRMARDLCRDVDLHASPEDDISALELL